METQLLPSGLFDLLPPYAGRERALLNALLETYAKAGYAQVNPPLMEYEENLLSGKGEAYAKQTFRLMDPISQRMMAIRADITMQIARIAATLLKQEARPLRLSYAGYTLRVKPEALKTSRQYRQVGIECFGATSPAAEVEVVTVAATALQNVGMTNLTVDLNYSLALDALLPKSTPHYEDVLNTIRRKDSAALRKMGHTLVADVADTAGPFATSMKKLRALKLPAAVSEALDDIEAAAKQIQAKLADAQISLDLLEMKGFGYYSGISFSIFLNDHSIEVGRGGHYVTEDGEPATGFTLYTADLLPAVPQNWFSSKGIA